MKRKWMFVLIVFMMIVLSSNAFMESGDSEFIYYSIVFDSNSIPDNFEDYIAEINGEIVYTVAEIGFLQIKAPSETYNTLKSLKDVESINPSMEWYKPQMNEAQLNNEFVVMPDPDKMWDLQWDIRQVTNDGKSYELGMGSHNVIVGIIDSGIDRDHPDLIENIVSGSKNLVPAGGFQGTESYESGNINDFDDLVGHGTHCAGTIAANGKMKGVAPNVGIRAYRVFGGGNAETIWITKALVEAANDGVDVISMSLGDYSIKGNAFYTDPETGKKEKLDNFVADITAYKRAVQYVQDKGSIIVASTGNDALNMASKKNVTNFMNDLYEGTGISFTGAGFDLPSAFSGVITVSATNPQMELASYSSYGAGIIDVTAPGGDVDLYMEYMMNGQLDKYFEEELHYQEFCLSTSKDGYYSMGVGTSMATPKVSAVVALLIDKYGKLSPNQIDQLLKKQATESVKGNDKKIFGSGHINAFNALQVE